MTTVIDMTNEDTVLVAMESTACDPHHAALPELSGVSSITSQVIRLQVLVVMNSFNNVVYSCFMYVV